MYKIISSNLKFRKVMFSEEFIHPSSPNHIVPSTSANKLSSLSPLSARTSLATPNMLQHGGYLCPDLFGPKSRQAIAPVPFSEFVKPGKPALVIPLFQRRFCWGNKIISQWWSDVCGHQCHSDKNITEYNTVQNRNLQGRHRVGKAVFKTMSDGRVCIIDGQQRIVTALLLIAAVRDAAIRSGNSAVTTLCNTALFRDTNTWSNWCDEMEQKTVSSPWQPFQPGISLPFATLTPSFADRAAFFELVTFGAIHNAELTAETRVSLQGRAYTFFANQIRTEINKGASLPDLACLALDGISFMRVDILNEINYGQVFLWLQENSLFGMVSLLWNPTPGEKFTAGDLVRNLLLSGFMDRSLSEQEYLFNELWVKSIELPCNGPAGIEAMLTNFLDTQDIVLKPGSFEQQLMQIEAKGIASFNPNTGIKLYARFVTYFEAITGQYPTLTQLEKIKLCVLKQLAEFVNGTVAKCHSEELAM